MLSLVFIWQFLVEKQEEDVSTKEPDQVLQSISIDIVQCMRQS